MKTKLFSVSAWDLKEEARDIELRSRGWDARADALRKACEIKDMEQRRRFLTARGFEVVGYSYRTAKGGDNASS